MKITFPHLGNTYLAFKVLMDGLGIDYVIPPFSNKKSLELGAKYSPEEICLPFKINLGNYIQSIEMGADTVIITGSCGPCRFGEYCELQMNILKSLGYDVDFIVIDSIYDIGKDELIRRLSKIGTACKKSSGEIIKSVTDALRVINLTDKIDKKARYLCGYEKNKGSFKKLLKEYKAKAYNTHTPYEMIKILKYYYRKLSDVEIDRSKSPLKIAVIGEIYTIIEPFSNLFLEDKLMNYGVSSDRYLTPSWWVKNMAMSPIKLNAANLKWASRKYLNYNIGGHGRECVGEAVMAAKNGFDGAIQLLPMGCMPEIVAKSIMPSISKEKNFPIMTLVIDEMTGDAGYDTRIEAFIDLLGRRKQNVFFRD